jgi:hypothetical protein
MSQAERTGVRDLLYSRWHRQDSINRFIGIRSAAMLKVVDIDWCEACQFCSQPVALIETQESKRAPKAATITQNLADLSKLPAYSVSYEPSADGRDIDGFAVQMIAPSLGEVARMMPYQYAKWLLALRDEHNRQHPECGAKTEGR